MLLLVVVEETKMYGYTIRMLYVWYHLSSLRLLLDKALLRLAYIVGRYSTKTGNDNKMDT